MESGLFHLLGNTETHEQQLTAASSAKTEGELVVVVYVVRRFTRLAGRLKFKERERVGMKRGRGENQKEEDPENHHYWGCS